MRLPGLVLVFMGGCLFLQDVDCRVAHRLPEV